MFNQRSVKYNGWVCNLSIWTACLNITRLHSTINAYRSRFCRTVPIRPSAPTRRHPVRLALPCTGTQCPARTSYPWTATGKKATDGKTCCRHIYRGSWRDSSPPETKIIDISFKFCICLILLCDMNYGSLILSFSKLLILKFSYYVPIFSLSC